MWLLMLQLQWQRRLLYLQLLRQIRIPHHWFQLQRMPTHDSRRPLSLFLHHLTAATAHAGPCNRSHLRNSPCPWRRHDDNDRITQTTTMTKPSLSKVHLPNHRRPQVRQPLLKHCSGNSKIKLEIILKCGINCSLSNQRIPRSYQRIYNLKTS